MSDDLFELDGALGELAGISSSEASDAMYILGLPDSVLDPSVRLLCGQYLLGRAVTIGRVPLPENASVADQHPEFSLAIQEVIDTAPRGAVLVTAVQGVGTHANWGGNQALRAKQVGMLGVVTDGAVRDIAAMPELGMTVFAQSCSPRSGQNRFATTVKNQPVVCAGVVIRPGDILLGDADGVVVIAPQNARAVAEKAKDIALSEKKMHAHINAGGTLKEAVQRYKVKR